MMDRIVPMNKEERIFDIWSKALRFAVIKFWSLVCTRGASNFAFDAKRQHFKSFLWKNVFLLDEMDFSKYHWDRAYSFPSKRIS